MSFYLPGDTSLSGVRPGARKRACVYEVQGVGDTKMSTGTPFLEPVIHSQPVWTPPPQPTPADNADDIMTILGFILSFRVAKALRHSSFIFWSSKPARKTDQEISSHFPQEECEAGRLKDAQDHRDSTSQGQTGFCSRSRTLSRVLSDTGPWHPRFNTCRINHFLETAKPPVTSRHQGWIRLLPR